MPYQDFPNKFVVAINIHQIFQSVLKPIFCIYLITTTYSSEARALKTDLLHLVTTGF